MNKNDFRNCAGDVLVEITDNSAEIEHYQRNLHRKAKEKLLASGISPELIVQMEEVLTRNLNTIINSLQKHGLGNEQIRGEVRKVLDEIDQLFERLQAIKKREEYQTYLKSRASIDKTGRLIRQQIGLALELIYGQN